MYRRVMAMAALALACAENGPSDLSSAFPATPFRYLRGVELGMSGNRLHALRTEAKYAPYLGLQERIPGFTVSYQFPTTMMQSSATDIGPDDKLEGVFISEVFSSLDKAEGKWAESVRAVSSSNRAPSACESFPSGGKQARWFSGKQILAIGVFPKEPLAPTVTDRVVYAISTADVMKQPSGATKIACPNN
jgi:hypothetical protein